MFITNARLLKPVVWITLILLLTCPIAAQSNSKPGTLQNETPQKFVATNDGFDHVRRDVMIPMRDGVKLHTVILIPKGAKGAPILLRSEERRVGKSVAV